ncbi:pyridoxal phosphate-dependent aminotransferase family protein [Rhizobium sp. L1K21]|uniref:aminotransferase class I/II-fold pyridoxal phosphate-dependent enzyme n=1 Tax=Rhizobium sp. L1K21 TaxID=2954933 RepID=UPI0020921BEC|nr:pyridoxal phosphate-dependent aminotransferase family protein [Rhizobium sp. L1K21]MCO6184841.1 pyridoxal phosphate-dependent aminotransferase family protein [Rhizobium sp. L1K21]
MRKNTFISKEALTGSLKDYRVPNGIDLIARTDAFYDWQQERRQQTVWPYARTISSPPAANCEALSDANERLSGVNFGSQDYMSLASHPKVKQAAVDAIGKFGVHSAGSAALLGNTALSRELEQSLSEFVGGREIVLYPTGWAAGYGAIQGLVRPKDHIVMDILSHSCLQEGAKAATGNIQFNRHLDLRSVKSKLQRIRQQDSKNAILVVTESLFSMHSNTPDLKGLRELCDRYSAMLLVDCAHDLGCMGENGLGQLETQDMLDGADIIIGSFSKSFASNGGFVSVKTRAAAEYLRYYSATTTFSNAMSPAQAAAVLTAVEIIRSQEGKTLRRALLSNILKLRTDLSRAGYEVLGVASPIVPVHVGDEARGRIISKEMSAIGAIANLVEYPAVPLGQTRFRLQVMAQHTDRDIETIVTAFRTCMDMTYTPGDLKQAASRMKVENRRSSAA